MIYKYMLVATALLAFALEQVVGGVVDIAPTSGSGFVCCACPLTERLPLTIEERKFCNGGVFAPHKRGRPVCCTNGRVECRNTVTECWSRDEFFVESKDLITDAGTIIGCTVDEEDSQRCTITQDAQSTTLVGTDSQIDEFCSEYNCVNHDRVQEGRVVSSYALPEPVDVIRNPVSSPTPFRPTQPSGSSSSNSGNGPSNTNSESSPSFTSKSSGAVGSYSMAIFLVAVATLW